jgi:hypothetical protein
VGGGGHHHKGVEVTIRWGNTPQEGGNTPPEVGYTPPEGGQDIFESGRHHQKGYACIGQ